MRLFHSQAIFLHLLLTASLIWAVVDISREIPPKGKLGIGFDLPFAKDGISLDSKPLVLKNWAYNSHVTFEEGTEISDAQLAQMTVDAYKEMEQMREEYGFENTKRQIDKNKPSAMIGLQFGNEIIFASSRKGKESLFVDLGDPYLSHVMNNCQMKFLESYQGEGDAPGHAHHTNCGEIVASHLFTRVYPDKMLQELKNEKPRVVAVHGGGPKKSGDEAKVIPPCGEGVDTWGCNLFVEDMKMRPIIEDARESYEDVVEKIEKTEVLSIVLCE